MNKVFVGLGLTLVLNFGVQAQNHKKSPEAGDMDKAKHAGKQRTTPSVVHNDANSPSVTSTVDLQAILQSTLDARRAKVGDKVLLKAVKSVESGGRTIVPKGSMLVGRITEVQNRANGGPASRLAVVFDRLEGKGVSEPITASIVSMANLTSGVSSGDLFESDLTGSAQHTSRSGGAGTGGLLGGVTGAVGGLTGAASTVAGVADAAIVTNTGSSVSGLAGRGLNGIQLSQAVTGTAGASTVLSSGGNNLRIEKGVTFNLRMQRTDSGQE